MESVSPEIVTSLQGYITKSLYPQVQHGLSERSVRIYVKNNLKVQAEHVLETVQESVGEVSQAGSK